MIRLSADLSILTVLNERLVEQRLPKLDYLKHRLDRGEILDDYDIWFLENALADARRNTTLVERHPEAQGIFGSLLHLYKEIMDLAVANEKNPALLAATNS
ncbi:hypothetical protein [Rhodocyclus tenuis]|uniref:Uncharacterized protein n=1 Tax=Rhodocyclus tenuis TaxID=1066 RepID=A0A840G914_RHOTE|nr:hypothetical protein [Rhodocyclus tenuis]MBB4247178.1 hypothetical protein [Rhodocyclus tenuis]